MDLIEHAKQTEMAEVDLDRLINVMHKSGLSYHDILKILLKQLEDTMTQFIVEAQLQATTHYNQNPAP